MYICVCRYMYIYACIHTILSTHFETQASCIFFLFFLLSFFFFTFFLCPSFFSRAFHSYFRSFLLNFRKNLFQCALMYCLPAFFSLPNPPSLITRCLCSALHIHVLENLCTHTHVYIHICTYTYTYVYAHTLTHTYL